MSSEPLRYLQPDLMLIHRRDPECLAKHSFSMLFKVRFTASIIDVDMSLLAGVYFITGLGVGVLSPVGVLVYHHQ